MDHEEKDRDEDEVLREQVIDKTIQIFFDVSIFGIKAQPSSPVLDSSSFQALICNLRTGFCPSQMLQGL